MGFEDRGVNFRETISWDYLPRSLRGYCLDGSVDLGCGSGKGEGRA